MKNQRSIDVVTTTCKCIKEKSLTHMKDYIYKSNPKYILKLYNRIKCQFIVRRQ